MIVRKQIAQIATDDRQPALSCVWLNASVSVAYAGNGYIMAEIPTEMKPGDESGPVPAAALALGSIDEQHAEVQLHDGQCSLGNFTVQYNRTSEINQPPFVDTLNAASDATKCDERPPDIVLDAALLARLVNAVSAKGAAEGNVVGIWLPTSRSAPQSVIVKTHSGVGVIMPVYVAESYPWYSQKAHF